MPDLSTTTEVMNNLAESEAKLGELNNRLVDIQDQYNTMAAGGGALAFLDFSNLYFWVVLIGLILLALGLLFLLVELSHPSPNPPKSPFIKGDMKSPPLSKGGWEGFKKKKKSKPSPSPVRRTGKKPVKIRVKKIK